MAGFELGGMDPGWANAKPGAPLRCLLCGDCANPLALLGEIDKAAGDERHKPLGALYTLLEPSTARRFSDDRVSLPIDASAILWMATANDASAIARPLVSRFVVFEIASPTPEQRPAVMRNVWRELHGRGPGMRVRFARCAACHHVGAAVRRSPVSARGHALVAKRRCTGGPDWSAGAAAG